MNPRSLIAEFMGTALLVFFGAGVAMLSFGFGVSGYSESAGVVATALTFGLVLLVMVYTIGPISGCHINPAVTTGFLFARRITMADAIGYWIAQFIGGIVGAAVLYAIARGSQGYSLSKIGLGADGYDSHSMTHLDAGGAFVAEVVLTFAFVLVILATTHHKANATVSGLVIGLSLALVHLIGIPLDGTSVNPARSLGPAVFVHGYALSQLWVFIIAPLVGGILSAAVYLFLYPKGQEEATVEPAPELTPEPAGSDRAAD